MKATRAFVVIALGALCLGMLHGAHAADVPEDAVQRIRDAAPDAAPAQPATPRRLLVFTRCQGFRHGSIPFISEAVRVLGEKTGAFEVVVSDDVGMFRPQNLAQFDAVCMNNTTGTLFEDEELKRALLDFVRGGKGIVGIHAATDCFYDWPEYGEMMGAYFHGHPWHEKVGIKVEEPDHPLCAVFGGADFDVEDEIYQFREPYSREKLRVLMRLDPARTNMDKRGVRRTDGDFAVSWIRNYGKGRVFYCSLGHRNEIAWNPVVLKHYLAGIQFALGDLAADATPSAQVTGREWQSLFNGHDLTGWECRPGGWHVEDGVIAWSEGAGFLWSEQRYGNFVLDLEFKLSPGTNSGVFVRTDSKPNWLHTGIEVQLLDSHGKDTPGRHDCGAVYDCLAPSENAVKPAGEWNRMAVTCKDNVVRVNLNGRDVIDMDLNQWTEAHRNPDGSPNKFDIAYKDMAREGYVALQDHGNLIWFRNIRIKVSQ